MQTEQLSMKHPFFYFIISLGFLIFSSCSPNEDENGDYLIGVDYNYGSSSNNSTIKNIKTITTVDTDGEKLIMTYNYTGSKLTSVTTNDNSATYNLTYTGDDVTRIIYTSVDDSGEKIVNTQDLTYTSGKLSKSVGTSKVSGTVIYNTTTTYGYSSDKIKSGVTKIKDAANTADLFSIQTDYSFSGNNVSTFKYTLKTLSSGPVSVTPIVLDMAFSSYDTKKNPLGTLPTAFKLVSAQFDMGSSLAFALSANNYKTVKLTTNAESITSNYNYVYDGDAYPILGTSAYGTVAFEYVK